MSERRARPTHLLLATLAAVAVASCGGDDGAGTPTSTTATSTTAPTPTTTVPPATPWAFTDDLDVTVELPDRPERIVMFEEVAASLMDFGIQPVGIHYIDDTEGSRLLKRFDLGTVTPVATSCSGVNVEAAAALDPDLFIYMDWGDGPDAAFCLDAAELQQLEAIAPVVRLRAEGDADTIRARYEELATALGAPGDAELGAKRERYDAAATALAAALAARPEISVLPLSLGPTWAGVAESGGFADLTTLAERYGIDFAGPFEGAFTGAYWSELSAETVTEFRGDVILLDARNLTSRADLAATYPLWAELPEVRAGQIVDWMVPGSFNYTRDAEFLEALTAAIESATDLVP